MNINWKKSTGLKRAQSAFPGSQKMVKTGERRNRPSSIPVEQWGASFWPYCDTADRIDGENPGPTGPEVSAKKKSR